MAFCETTFGGREQIISRSREKAMRIRMILSLLNENIYYV